MRNQLCSAHDVWLCNWLSPQLRHYSSLSLFPRLIVRDRRSWLRHHVLLLCIDGLCPKLIFVLGTGLGRLLKKCNDWKFPLLIDRPFYIITVILYILWHVKQQSWMQYNLWNWYLTWSRQKNMPKRWRSRRSSKNERENSSANNKKTVEHIRHRKSFSFSLWIRKLCVYTQRQSFKSPIRLGLLTKKIHLALIFTRRAITLRQCRPAATLRMTFHYVTRLLLLLFSTPLDTS